MANKIKKVIKVKESTNDDIKFKQLIIIFIVMILITGGVYYLTDVLIKKDKDDSQSSSEIIIDYSLILLSELLNQSAKKYYVLAIDFKSDEFADYKTMVDDFANDNNEKISIYKSNLSDGLNKKYIGDTSNKTVKKISELKVSGPTLIQIEDGKITGYYEGSKEITKRLK